MGAPQPPKKKGMSGCLLAFLVVFGVFIVGGGIAGFFIYRTFVGPFKEMMAVVQEGQNAPGTDALRAAGCKQASAMDSEKLFKVVSEFADKFGAKSGQLKPPDAPTTVLCTLEPSKELTCDQVAEKYVSAAAPKDKFSVMVQEHGSGSQHNSKCSYLYDASGTRLGDATPFNIQTN